MGGQGGWPTTSEGREAGARARALQPSGRSVTGGVTHKALTALAGLSAGFVRRTGCPVDLTYRHCIGIVG